MEISHAKFGCISTTAWFDKVSQFLKNKTQEKSIIPAELRNFFYATSGQPRFLFYNLLV